MNTHDQVDAVLAILNQANTFADMCAVPRTLARMDLSDDADNAQITAAALVGSTDAALYVYYARTWAAAVAALRATTAREQDFDESLVVLTTRPIAFWKKAVWVPKFRQWAIDEDNDHLDGGDDDSDVGYGVHAEDSDGEEGAPMRPFAKRPSKPAAKKRR